MQIYPLTYSIRTNDNRQIMYSSPNIVSFCAGIPDLDCFKSALNNRNNILSKEIKSTRNFFKYAFYKLNKLFSRKKSLSDEDFGFIDHKWTLKEIESVEGLQQGLKIFEGMNIKQIYFILNTIKQKGLNMPIVRGCYHNCAHCFVDAKAPIERMSYEDFHNFVSELSTMYKRFGINPKHDSWHITGLFHDSDGSELYLSDKNGNEHEYPELINEITKKLKTPSFFDTAGWNLKSEKTQKRMERLVYYYKSHPEAFDKEIRAINLSLNPFHSFRVTALKQLKNGNIDNYNKLYNLYLDMVANTLNTFAPLLESEKINFLCRAYSEDIKSPKLDGFRISDMEKIKQDVILHFKSMYPQTIEKYPHIIDALNEKITISPRIAKSGRNNDFNKYSIKDRYQYPPKTIIPNEKLIQDLMDNNFNRAFINLNGDFYIINDFVSYKTNLSLNFNNKVTNKKMLPPVHFQTVEI